MDRMKMEKGEITPMHLSIMMILCYLSDLDKMGVVKTPYPLTSVGENFRSVCEEFEWIPDNDEITQFVKEMIDDPELKAPFLHFITRYRDDKEGLQRDVKKAQDSQDTSFN